MVIDMLQRSILHDFSRIHDRSLIADLCHNTKIMGNKQQRGFLFLLQLLDPLQHLCLNGYIQCRGMME